MPTNQIINDVIPWTQASSSSNQVIFDTNWTAAYPGDVVVYQRGMDEEPDELTQMLLESEYVVTFIGSGQMVRVTLVNPATTGDIVTITRNTAVDRLNLYTNTNFVPGMLNQDTAILTLVDQERAMLNDMAVKYHISGPNPNFTLTNNPPVVPLGPNQIWAMNPDGDAIIAYNVPEGGGLATDDATYILQEPRLGLPNAQALNALPTGFMVSNNGTGEVVTRYFEGVEHQTSVFNPTGVDDNPIIGIADNVILPGTAGMGVPSGTTAERVIPIPPSIGLRFNTDTATLEAYINSTWVQIPSAAAGLFLPLNGGTMAGNINMNSQGITNLINPTLAQDAATKGYVDDLVAGLNPNESVVAASTANLNATYNNGTSGVGATLTNAGTQAAFVLDGISLSLNDRVLIKNMTTQAYNGIYTVTNAGSVSTNWVLTRAIDYDTPDDINDSGVIPVLSGSTQNLTAWLTTSKVTTIGTDPIVFVQFGVFSGILAVANGGSGLNSLTPYALMAGGTTSTSIMQQVSPSTAGYLLQSGGAGALPSFTNTPNIGTPSAGNLSNCTGLPIDAGTVGVLPSSRGGTGVNNSTRTMTYGGNVTFNGAFTTQFNVGQNTNVTLPATGTLLAQTSSTAFAPTITFATPGNLSVVYTIQNGYYLRTGNIVTLCFNIACTPTFTTASGTLQIVSPITSAALTNYFATGELYFSNFTTLPSGRTNYCLQMQQNSNAIQIAGSGAGVSAANVAAANLTSGTAIVIVGTITYLT